MIKRGRRGPATTGRRQPTPIDEGIEEQTEDGVEEGEKHGRQSWQVDPRPVARPPLGRRREFLDGTRLEHAPCGLGRAGPDGKTFTTALGYLCVLPEIVGTTP